MELDIAVASVDTPRAVASLHDWLSRENAFRGRVSVARRPVQPGEMGGIIDVLTVTLGAGGVGAVLAHSLQVWLQQQRSHVKLTIRRPGGSEIEIDASNVRDVQALVESASRDGFHG